MEEGNGIVLNEDGRFTTSFKIDSRFKCHIIGKGGQQIKRIKSITNTLVICGRDKDNEQFTIIGDTASSVAASRSKISQIIRRTKKKEFGLHHFVSIPFINNQIRNNLQQFMENILRNPPRGVTKSSFRCPSKLHLNISYLILHNTDEINKAIDVLNKCYEETISNLFPKAKKYRLILQGLTILPKEDAAKASYLFGKVTMEDSKENENFQTMVKAVHDAFNKTGFVQNSAIHTGVTIMNRLSKENWRKYETFDLSGILEKYGDFYFGNVEFDSIHLSVAGTADECYYEAAHSIEL